MIEDKTLDEALIEIMRTKKALERLRAAVKHADAIHEIAKTSGEKWLRRPSTLKEHAAAKRASLDLTRKLADLRAGR